MELSNNLVSQFVKATKDSEKKNAESTVYGTTVLYNDRMYVKLDGSDQLTPITKTTNVKENERVTVRIKDHTATVTGNITSPSARTGDVEDMGDAILLQVDELYADKAVIGELEADIAEIEKLVADSITTEKLEAELAEIEKLIAGSITTDELEAELAYIDTIYARKAEIESLDAKYANIDFANVTEADIDKLLARSAIIEEVTSSDGTFTRNLTAVTINGDLIEASTIKVDKLIVKGTDGKYYALNTDFSGITGVEPVEEDAIHGSILIAKSITADKVSVTDLVAFNATIGGFNITTKSLYSGVKESADNTTRGVYLDKDGQMSVGDSNNFLRYYKDDNGDYHLGISASSLVFSASGKTVEQTIDEATDLEIGARNLIRNSKSLVFADYGFASAIHPVDVGVDNGVLTMTARPDSTSSYTAQIVDGVLTVTEQYETEATVHANIVNDTLVVG